MYQGPFLSEQMMHAMLFLQQGDAFGHLMEAMMTTAGQYGTLEATFFLPDTPAGVTYFQQINVPGFPTDHMSMTPLVVAMKNAEFRLENKQGETPLYLPENVKRVTGYQGGVRISSAKGDFSAGFSGWYQEFDRLLAWVFRLALEDEPMSFHHFGVLARDEEHLAQLVKVWMTDKGLVPVAADVPGQKRFYAAIRNNKGHLMWMQEVVLVEGEGSQYDEDLHFDICVLDPMGAAKTLQKWVTGLKVETLSDHGPGPRVMVSLESPAHNASLSIMFRHWDDRNWIPAGMQKVYDPLLHAPIE